MHYLTVVGGGEAITPTSYLVAVISAKYAFCGIDTNLTTVSSVSLSTSSETLLCNLAGAMWAVRAPYL